MRISPRLTLLTAATFLLPMSLSVATSSSSPYEAYAIRYATIPGFPVRGLIAGADSARRLDIAMMVWLLRDGQRTVLVDAGFHHERFVERWKPRDFVTPAAAVERFGVSPQDVTDIIVTHVHWDHADGLELFPRATVWIQKAEYDHHVAADGSPRDRAIEPEVSTVLKRLKDDGRLRLVDGDAKEILPGIVVYTGGKHTFESQYVAAATAAGTVVIASDNAYLYENFDRRVPIAQTLDTASNLRAQERMRTIATEARLIVPGHDPAVFERFPRPGNGVARIQ
jgi:glyoxylase-like metal-dependent hydrolase (beta-lactamase superfamily II)